MARVAVLLLALAAAASTVSCAPPLRPWVNTSVGIHRFLAFDSALTAEQVNATAEEYDYVWGASAEYVQLWKAHSPDLIVSVYIPMTRDFRVCRTEPEPEESMPFHWPRNLSWWQAHHPDWIMYKADRKTPAYQYDDPCCVPLDISNTLVRQFQLNNCTSAAVAAGYDATTRSTTTALRTTSGALACAGTAAGSSCTPATAPTPSTWRTSSLGPKPPRPRSTQRAFS
jgi:hypothetical protein